MKAKKAVKRLDKVVAILSDVIKQYAPIERHVREQLGAAKASVGRAKAAVNSSGYRRTATKARVMSKKTKQKRVIAAARKELSVSAKRRRAVAKSNGVHAMKKAAVNSSVSRRTATQVPVVAKKTKQQRLIAAARKEVSHPAKKQRAVAKSKGVQAGKNPATAAGNSWTATSGELAAKPSAPSEALFQTGKS
jgi:hypothetical protein